MLSGVNINQAEESLDMGKDVEIKRTKDSLHVKIHSYDILYWKLPIEEQRKIGGEGQIEPLKVGAVYESSRKNTYDGVIYASGLGLYPIDVWKQKVANELAFTSGKTVKPEDVNIQPQKNPSPDS